MAGEMEQSICDGNRGGVQRGGGFGANQSLLETEQAFLFAEIDLDVPAVQVGLENIPDRSQWIGANQVSLSFVEVASVLLFFVMAWSDSDEPELHLPSRFSREQSRNGFVAEANMFAVDFDITDLPGDVLVFCEFFGSWSLLAIDPAAPFGSGMDGRIMELGVFADPPDQSRPRGQVFEHGFVGETRVSDDPKVPVGMLSVELGAEGPRSVRRPPP